MEWDEEDIHTTSVLGTKTQWVGREKVDNHIQDLEGANFLLVIHTQALIEKLEQKNKALQSKIDRIYKDQGWKEAPEEPEYPIIKLDDPLTDEEWNALKEDQKKIESKKNTDPLSPKDPYRPGGWG